jgi:hypothetical protein
MKVLKLDRFSSTKEPRERSMFCVALPPNGEVTYSFNLPGNSALHEWLTIRTGAAHLQTCQPWLSMMRNKNEKGARMS